MSKAARRGRSSSNGSSSSSSSIVVFLGFVVGLLVWLLVGYARTRKRVFLKCK